MIIKELLKTNDMTMYQLSKLSGVSQSTISDICSGSSSIEKCSAGTLHKIAKVLNVTVDMILDADEKERNAEHRCSFDVYKSTVCHQVKELGDMQFVIETLEKDVIRTLFNRGWYMESLYLLAMLDYLSRINDLPICTNYNDLRCCKLDKVVYPSGVLIQSIVHHDSQAKQRAIEESIPEFIRFNIVEAEVRNVV